MTILITTAALALLAGTMWAQEQQATIYVVELRGDIHRGLPAYVERAFSDANGAEADAIIIDIDSDGGNLDAALQIRRTILDSDVRTIAYISDQALSHAALIAISSDEIYFAPGAVLGGQGDGSTERAMRERYRTSAQAQGRDPAIAEAMIDPRVSIEGLSERGSLLAIGPDIAITRGYANGVAADIDEVLRLAGFASVEVLETSPGIAEQAVRFLTNPFVAAILFAIGLVFIVGDLAAGGISLLSAAGFLLLTAFFWGHALAGLAGWEGIALVALGLVLVAVEIFVLPGIGVSGIAGALCVLAGFALSLTSGERAMSDQLWEIAGFTALVIIIGVAGVAALFWLLPMNVRFHGLVLEENLGRDRIAAVVRQGRRSTPDRSGDEPPADEAERYQELTDREREVLTRLAVGSSNKEIADELSISVRTVERHVTNIYGKLGVRNRGEAIAFAHRNNLT